MLTINQVLMIALNHSLNDLSFSLINESPSKLLIINFDQFIGLFGSTLLNPML